MPVPLSRLAFLGRVHLVHPDPWFSSSGRASAVWGLFRDWQGAYGAARRLAVGLADSHQTHFTSTPR